MFRLDRNLDEIFVVVVVFNVPLVVAVELFPVGFLRPHAFRFGLRVGSCEGA